MVPLTRDHRNLVVVRSLSESFAMPGMPVSYCVAHPCLLYTSRCV